jgi:hypothetical protein
MGNRTSPSHLDGFQNVETLNVTGQQVQMDKILNMVLQEDEEDKEDSREIRR